MAYLLVSFWEVNINEGFKEAITQKCRSNHFSYLVSLSCFTPRTSSKMGKISNNESALLVLTLALLLIFTIAESRPVMRSKSLDPYLCIKNFTSYICVANLFISFMFVNSGARKSLSSDMWFGVWSEEWRHLL